MENKLIFGTGFNPWHNLALEAMLFDMQGPGCTLYLWQNQNTVVIGKNQNAWKECRISLLEQEQGRLARRPSGGGAVFHDVGNLNFTFVADTNTYNLERQLKVILDAVSSLNIKAAYTGRNDIVLEDGAKFSGNAFRKNATTALQHGTLLMHVDMEKLGRYLAPSKEKMAAKGVDSVRSRVRNLCDINPAITIEGMKEALCQAFINEYGPATLMQERDLDQQKLQKLEETFSSWEWNKGETPRFDITFEHRFEWGGVEFNMQLKKGHIEHLTVYSDAMDSAFIDTIAPALIGCPFSCGEMAMRFRALPHPLSAELADWMLSREF